MLFEASLCHGWLVLPSNCRLYQDGPAAERVNSVL